ncbi:MAG: dipeptide epimerase [Bradyrhizobium sp.]|nr:dipeptide epimerase [Bradyrhizobium sp.]
MTPLSLSVTSNPMRFTEPLRIAGRVFEGIPAVRVTLDDGCVQGRGEGGGVFYRGDDVPHMLAAIEQHRPDIEKGIDRQALRETMPPGGARNAVDAALWELEARRLQRPMWQLAHFSHPPRPRVTTFTLGADEPAQLLAKLASYGAARAIKLKLDGNLDGDAERLRLVRTHRPDVWLMADANQGYTVDRLDALLPHLVAAGVALLEQPIARGLEQELVDFKSPIPLAADESLLDLTELPALAGVFQVANIKLDKCGGLTEGLLIEEAARRMGLGVMVGNMGGSSLAAAPAFLLSQRCDHVDLDGPTFLASDQKEAVSYTHGEIYASGRVWGFPDQDDLMRG